MSLRDLRDVSGLTLSDRELMELLDLKKSEFYKRRKLGAFVFLECSPRLGRRRQYSGALVQRWRDGVGASSPFGKSFKVA